MIPLPPAKLTVVKAPTNDVQTLGARIESVLLPESNIRSGCRILIKPSALLLDHAGRESHLAVLAALVAAMQRRGAEVSVGDSPGEMLQPTQQYWRESGLFELAERSGCELFSFEAAASEAIMVDSRVYYLPTALEEFDLIVNVAAFGLGYDNNLSGVLQNCLGFLPGRQIDSWDKAVAAVDLYARVSPEINILQFDYREETYLIFGHDGVAVDTAFFSRLNPKSRPKCLHLAADAGIGLGHAEMVVIEGDRLPDPITLEPREFNFRKSALSLLERISPINVFKTDRIVAGDKCDGCAECCDLCPTGSIKISESGGPVWNMSRCVECWRCREHCHSNAITVSIDSLRR